MSYSAGLESGGAIEISENSGIGPDQKKHLLNAVFIGKLSGLLENDPNRRKKKEILKVLLKRRQKKQ